MPTKPQRWSSHYYSWQTYVVAKHEGLITNMWHWVLPWTTTLRTQFPEMDLNIILLSLQFSKWLVLKRAPQQTSAYIYCLLIQVPHPAHCNYLDFTILTIQDSLPIFVHKNLCGRQFITRHQWITEIWDQGDYKHHSFYVSVIKTGW
jgi:hypothetical protein